MIRLELEATGMQIAKIKAGIIKTFGGLRDNPNITYISSNRFIEQSKNLGKSWAPFYHDFRAQYRKLAAIGA